MSIISIVSIILAVIFTLVSAFLIFYYVRMNKQREEGGRMGFTQTKGTVSADTDENGDLTWGD
jgi:hypothetical protein